MDHGDSALRANALLARLDAAALQAIAPRLERVALPFRQTLYEERRAMTHAWFPSEGAVSVLGAASAAETPIEVATVGSEGMIGVPIVLGARESAGMVFVQIEGAGWRIAAADLQACFEAQPSLRDVLQRYAYALLVQASQGTACNRAHTAEQRGARWLLQTHDRVRGNAFDLTQEFLAQMLGERRATVNQVAGTFQERGLIRYSRGHIEVVDRAGLEAVACGCYAFVREEYARVLPEPA